MFQPCEAMHNASPGMMRSNFLGHVCITCGCLNGIHLALCDVSFSCLARLSNDHIGRFFCTSSVGKFGIFLPFQAEHDQNTATSADNGCCKKQNPKGWVFSRVPPPAHRNDRTTAAVKVVIGGENGKCAVLCFHSQLQWCGLNAATCQQGIVPVPGGGLLVDVD
eukprot:Skav220993  [mRNA]  locus=scaffold1541:288189:288680:- [translate_table: standard]